jgi:GTPase SAR1 family protein
LNFWKEEVNVHKDRTHEYLPIVLIGNKVDHKKRVITEERARKYAEQNSMKYIETSAKKNINIDKFFSLLIQEIYDNMDKNNQSIGIKKFIPFGNIQHKRVIKHKKMLCCKII